MERTRWVERSFNFDFPTGILPSILERLRGTELRMKDIIKDLTDDELSNQPEGKWSIKEQIGHLADLEDLHISRLREMIARNPVLTAADMSNKKTEGSNHNKSSASALIETFSSKRREFVDLLCSMDDDTLSFSSLHPRLQIQMRPVDVAYFTAEHDDHHLASMREILG